MQFAFTKEMTWLDDEQALGMGVLEVDIPGLASGGFLGVRANMDELWLDLATPDMYDTLVRMYNGARLDDDPMVLDDYPEEEEILARLEAGEMWVLRERSDGSITGACAITTEPPLSREETVFHRGYRADETTRRLPAEHWYSEGKYYFTITRPCVRPPRDPFIDVAVLITYAVRAAASMGRYDLRAKVNLRNRALCSIFKWSGFSPVCMVRRESGEVYVGYYICAAEREYREITPSGYRSPAYEKMTDEEYARFLEQLGIEKEEDGTYLPRMGIGVKKYDEDDEEEISFDPPPFNDGE